MFTVDERERLREWLIDRAETDEAVAGAACTGSLATGDGDRWSDTDLALAVRGDVGETAARWTRWLDDEFGTQHHWDLASGAAVIRVFLFRGWLELDLTFAPEAEFGPRGPRWRTVFGEPQELAPWPGPDRGTCGGRWPSSPRSPRQNWSCRGSSCQIFH